MAHDDGKRLRNIYIYKSPLTNSQNLIRFAPRSLQLTYPLSLSNFADENRNPMEVSPRLYRHCSHGPIYLCYPPEFSSPSFSSICSAYTKSVAEPTTYYFPDPYLFSIHRILWAHADVKIVIWSIPACELVIWWFERIEAGYFGRKVERRADEFTQLLVVSLRLRRAFVLFQMGSYRWLFRRPWPIKSIWQ